jgi:hypothetical protein
MRSKPQRQTSTGAFVVGRAQLTRRVLRVKECAEDRIVLEVQRFGRTSRTAWNFGAPILHEPQAGLRANNFALASNAFSRNAFLIRSLIR